jgi:hypothetical protein
MTDTTRCDPPEHLRGVDGWHWLSRQNNPDECWEWRVAIFGWGRGGQSSSPLQMASYGVRYLAPVAPPDLVRKLVETLVECADDLEAEVAARYNGIRHYPTMAADEKRDMEPVAKARATLARAKEAGV